MITVGHFLGYEFVYFVFILTTDCLGFAAPAIAVVVVIKKSSIKLMVSGIQSWTLVM